MKQNIIEYIFSLIESNIYASNAKNFNLAFRNRIIGFRYELHFFIKFSPKAIFSAIDDS